MGAVLPRLGKTLRGAAEHARPAHGCLSELNGRREELQAYRLDSVFNTNMLGASRTILMRCATLAWSSARPGVVNLVPAFRALYGEAD